MPNKIILSLIILQFGQNISFSQTTDYPAKKNTKEPISISKCNKIYLPIIDTTISLCNKQSDTLTGKKSLNGKPLDYEVSFFGNIGTCQITLNDTNENNNSSKRVIYKLKGSSKQYRYGKELICDVYGNCKSMKIKIYTPTITKKTILN
ncbi:MAG: hypothetical protein ACKVOM_13955 [Ferruginibacter sp.]